MTSKKQPPDARGHDPFSSRPKPPDRKLRTSTGEVAELASKTRDASLKTPSKMRHRFLIFPRNQHKQLDFENAQNIAPLPAKMRHSRPEDRRGRRSTDGKAISLPISPTAGPADPRSSWQTPPKAVANFATPIESTKNWVRSFISPHTGPRAAPLWPTLPKAVEWSYPLPPPGGTQARSPVLSEEPT
jgi:hypothetical protein